MRHDLDPIKFRDIARKSFGKDSIDNRKSTESTKLKSNCFIKNLIINNKVIKAELTNSNDLFIWLENDIQLQIFISSGFPHYVEDCEQWRIFENDGENMPHTVVYSNCIQEE